MYLRVCIPAFLVAWTAAAAVAQSPVSEAPSAIARKMGRPFYSGAILPTPQEADYGPEVVELLDGPGGQTKCRLDLSKAGRVQDLLMRLWQQRIRRYGEQFPALNATPCPTAVPLVFALASDAELQGIPSQGYRLTIGPEGVLCLGRDEPGLVHGLASLLQLLQVRDGRLVACSAKIRDWPVFTTRYLSEYRLPGDDFFDWMMTAKINGFAIAYPGMRWEGLGDVQRERLKGIGQYVTRYGTLQFLVQLHVGGRGGCRPVDCGSETDVARLLATIHETLRLSHAAHLMICYDDVQAVLQPQEKGRWARPAQAHESLMQQVYEAGKAHDPRLIVSFCSPHYQGRNHRRWRAANPGLQDALAYMADLKAWKNRDIRIVWTGPQTESRSIVQADLDHYLGLVGADRKLFYWDNTWHYHQPLRNFHARYLPGFVDHCADRTSYVNINALQPIGRFFAVTANDYYWNPDAFDAVRARQHAVAQLLGPPALAAAERFYALRGDDYFVNFKKRVDIEALNRVLRDLEATSIDPEIARYCRTVYEAIVRDSVKP